MGLIIECNLIGVYCILLDMIGFLIILLKVDDEMLVFWDVLVYILVFNWGK